MNRHACLGLTQEANDLFLKNASSCPISFPQWIELETGVLLNLFLGIDPIDTLTFDSFSNPAMGINRSNANAPAPDLLNHAVNGLFLSAFCNFRHAFLYCSHERLIVTNAVGAHSLHRLKEQSDIAHL